MKRQPCGTIRISKTKRVSYWTTKELETGNQVDGRSTEEYKEAVQ